MWIGVPLLPGAAVLAAWIWIDTRHEPAPASRSAATARIPGRRARASGAASRSPTAGRSSCACAARRSQPDRCIECGATLPVSHPWPRCTACFLGASSRRSRPAQLRTARRSRRWTWPTGAAIARLLAGVDRVWQSCNAGDAPEVGNVLCSGFVPTGARCWRPAAPDAGAGRQLGRLLVRRALRAVADRGHPSGRVWADLYRSGDLARHDGRAAPARDGINIGVVVSVPKQLDRRLFCAAKPRCWPGCRRGQRRSGRCSTARRWPWSPIWSPICCSTATRRPRTARDASGAPMHLCRCCHRRTAADDRTWSSAFRHRMSDLAKHGCRRTSARMRGGIGPTRWRAAPVGGTARHHKTR